MCESLGGSRYSGYEDAENPNQAVHMIKSILLVGHIMKKECQSRYPEISAELTSNLNGWILKEADVLKKTEFHWSEMEKLNPKLLEYPAQLETMIKGHFEELKKTPRSDSKENVRDYCNIHLATFSSDMWRYRHPRAFEYIDKAAYE